MVLCLLILISALLPGGCWDAHELNTLSIVAGVGIDAAEDSDVDVTVQIRKVTKPSDGMPEQPYILFSGTGKTILEGIENIRLENNRDLFLHQNQVIIISQEQAERGIRELLDMFLRYHETRLEVWVVISKCRADELMQVKQVQEPVTSSAVALMIQNRSDQSSKLAVNMLNVTSSLLDASSALVVPLFDTVDEFGQTKIKINGSAIIVSGKMVGELSEDETLGFTIGSGNIKSGLLQIETPDGAAVLYLSDSKAQVKTRLNEGHVEADVSIKASFSVAEIKGFEGKKLPEVYGLLEQAGVSHMVELVSAAFEKSRTLDADIFGIGTEMNHTHPKDWKAIKDQWKSLYPQTTMKITVEGNLLESGKISDSLSMRGAQ